jgi:putative flippase GtrA
VPSKRAGTSNEAALFGRYLLAGGAAAASNYGSRFIFSRWIPFELAVVCAFGVGLLTGFTLMRRFVFDGARKPLRPQVAKYLVVNLIALVQTLVVSSVLARWLLPSLGVDARFVEAVAHAFGVGVPVVTSYFGHRHATFK